MVRGGRNRKMKKNEHTKNPNKASQERRISWSLSSSVLEPVWLPYHPRILKILIALYSISQNLWQVGDFYLTTSFLMVSITKANQFISFEGHNEFWYYFIKGTVNSNRNIASKKLSR